MNPSLSPPPGPQSRPKAILFCPGCSHESHVSGDWIVRASPQRITTECPACGHRIDDRPRRPSRSGERSPTIGIAPSLEAVVTPVAVLFRLRRYVLDWWVRHRERFVSSPTSA